MPASKAAPLVSAVDGLPIRRSGAWIAQKHFFLNRYCGIFTKAMKKKWKLVYLDLFAGPGRCLVDGDAPHETDGSPLIALSYDFDRFIFVEENKADHKALVARCKRSPQFNNIQFILNDCNRVAEIINSQLNPNELCFAFVDPTGIDVHFETIKKISTGRKVDLLINVMFGMDIKRNFEKYYQGKEGSKLNRFVGSSIDWTKVKTPTETLDYYKAQMARLGYSTVRFKDMEVKNQKNVPMYFLFFAARHAKALEFWDKITNKEQTGQGMFNFQ